MKDKIKDTLISSELKSLVESPIMEVRDVSIEYNQAVFGLVSKFLSWLEESEYPLAKLVSFVLALAPMMVFADDDRLLTLAANDTLPDVSMEIYLDEKRLMLHAHYWVTAIPLKPSVVQLFEALSDYTSRHGGSVRVTPITVSPMDFYKELSQSLKEG